MPTIKTRDGTEIYYKDWGSGQPITFSHGWPLTADAWEDQVPDGWFDHAEFLAACGVVKEAVTA